MLLLLVLVCVAILGGLQEYEKSLLLSLLLQEGHLK